MPQGTEPPVEPRVVITPLRTILATLVVVSLCAALSAGSYVRDWADQGSKGGEKIASGRSLDDSGMTGIVASRQKEAGGINLDAYYDAVEETLKEQYVEPINSESKLAVGAIHGMITSLSDPNSRYMDKEAFGAYLQEQEGHFTGIGADFSFQSTGVDLSGDEQALSDTDPTSDFASTRIPRLTINSVVPGGP